MVRIDEAAIVSYEHNGLRFEVLADPDSVLTFREGKTVDFRNVLALFEIYKDARRAEKASESDLKNVFGTLNPEEIAKVILKKGEFHPTTEQKKKMLDKVKRQVVEIIVSNSVDPRNNLPHTRERIEWGLKESKVKIELRPASEQIDKIVKELRLILPLRFGTTKLRIIVPSKYAPSLYGKIKKLGKKLKESWLANGSLQVTIEVPSGQKVDIMTDLGNATSGEVIVKEE